MSTHHFRESVELDTLHTQGKMTVEIPTAPEKAKSRVYHSVPLTPSDIELEHMNFGSRYVGQRELSSNPPSGMQTPMTMDLEMSRPPSPDRQNEVSMLQSFWHPRMNRYRMATVCLANFTCGMSDSAPGVLIPIIEKYYGIGYAVVSLIFVTNAVGFILAAFFIEALRARLGRAKTLMLGYTFMAAGYIPVVCTPPFAVVVACFFFLGFGIAIGLALGNVFAANLQNGTTMLGAMHGSYGIGGTIGPILATAMVTSGNVLWSRYYLVPLGVVILNAGFSLWAFWDFEAETAASALLTEVQRTTSGATIPQENQVQAMIKALKSRIVILGALFIFAYQGAEVSISGWVISFLIASRQHDPDTIGYVTSGFWGGITIGRLFLSPVAHSIGEKRFVYGAIVAAALFQSLVWGVPNVIGDAVAVSIVGLMLGPIYPCAAMIFTRLIPKKEQVSGLGLISAFGSSGGAVSPFTVGILAQAVGTYVLHPITIALFVVMTLCWNRLPSAKHRSMD